MHRIPSLLSLLPVLAALRYAPPAVSTQTGRGNTSPSTPTTPVTTTATPTLATLPTPQDPPARDTAPLVIPAHCKDKPGGGNNSIPFSWTPSRWQQLFGPESFQFDGTLLLGGVSFRRDLKQQAGSGTVELEVSIATFPGKLEDATAVFDDNAARNRQVVVPRRKILLQSSDEREDVNKDPLGIFDVHLVFERPYKYRTDRDGVLVLEVRAFGNDQGDKLFQFALDATQNNPAPIRRVFAPLDSRQGTLDATALVTRFDVLASAATSRPRPASNPAPAPGTRPTGSSEGRSPASVR